MDYFLKYGKEGLPLNFDDQFNITVLQPRNTPGVTNPDQLLTESLQHPIGDTALAEKVTPESKIGIIINDITRATPTRFILEGVLHELSTVPSENITLFIALGTHRKDSPDELKGILGEENFNRFRIVQNDCEDQSTQTCLGKSSLGHDVWLNSELLKCDLILLTGFIEPHLFAGFSGGGKAIMPGMAGKTTIMQNHGIEMIGNSQAIWGVTVGNPIWEEIQEIAEMAGKIFLINITMNNQREITGVFCGNLRKAHAEGVKFVKSSSMVEVPHAFDLVITTNDGFPLDQNLYQSFKGISAAARIVKPGGAIIMASECIDGIGIQNFEHFEKILKIVGTPQRLLFLLKVLGSRIHDRWQMQILAQNLSRTHTFLYSALPDKEVKAFMLEPTHDIVQTCRNLYPGAQICIMPHGPLSIPFVSEK